MYNPSFILNTPPKRYNVVGLDFYLSKGVEVTIKEDWQELLLNVSTQKCRQSFRKIFDHFFPLLISHGLKNGLSKEVASELAQDTMIKVWSQASSFDANKGNASVWIFTIARNLRYDYFRSHKNDPLKIASSELYTLDSDEDSTTIELEALFDAKLLKKHVTDLPPEQKDVIEKIYFNGFTQEEISKIQNIPLGTVKSRVRLAIANIKEKVGGELK